MSISEEKAALRQYAAALPKAEIGSLADQFAGLPQIRNARTVLMYYGVGREIDTLPLIRLLLQRGQQVALPVCLPGHRMDARLISDPARLVPNRWGIPEPTPACPVVEPSAIDAVLVPCVLCDAEGYRLGHGGGFYDRWLADYHGFTVCICPKTHMVPRVPREAFDLPVCLVLTQP